MRRRRQTQDDEAVVDMTPMLDLVFIMLIFFIVSAVFLDERGLDLSETPQDVPPNAVQPSILVQLDDRDMAHIQGQPLSLASVPARVQALRAQSPQANVSLQAQSDTSVDAVVFLKDRMDAAQVPITIKVDP
ncbi:ExbD/TolR family protein [Algimonas porphyrae]|uniref:Biopolymer transporter ExbD n=1 Tax=Algimonas porphyrae TaxID=1128113 RepID=A0ABQ5UWU7_9PROT|nr:biopolymer transporter ExbD [Algimonas porphyrae]GLQ19347.1 biopolymer transporter ExbD [Algimonas porphyrae]